MSERMPSREELNAEIEEYSDPATIFPWVDGFLRRDRQLLSLLDLLAEVVPRLEHTVGCASRDSIKVTSGGPGTKVTSEFKKGTQCDCGLSALLARIKAMGIET